MKVAILGAGAAGCTMAADLKSKGHEIRLFDLPQYSENLTSIRKQGGIRLTGELTGNHMPDLLTSDIDEATDHADITMLVVPGFAHEAFMDACLPSLPKNQIMLNWTSYWSSLRFYPRARRIGRSDIVMAEASILPYMTEKTLEGNILIRAVKEQLWIAALPTKHTTTVLNVVKDLYPQAIGVENVLWTSLNNINVPFHVVTAMMNAALWEHTTGDFDFFGYGITPAVGRVADAVDQERMNVAKALGITTLSLPKLLNKVYSKYGASGDTSYDTLHNLRSHATWHPRVSFMNYGDVQEDVPFGLVPLASFGDQFRVPTPMIDSIIYLASVAVQKDFLEIGADVKKLGVKGMSKSRIIRYVTHGR